MRTKPSKPPGKTSRPRPPAPEPGVPLEAHTRHFRHIDRELGRLFGSTDIALLFVDRDGLVRNFTPPMRALLDLPPDATGQLFRNLKLHLEDPALVADIQTALDAAETSMAEVTSRTGQVYVRLVLPCRTGAGRVEGAVVACIGISRRKPAETALRTGEEHHRRILESVTEYAILLLDLDGRFVNWTASAESILGYKAREAIGQHLQMLHAEEDRHPAAVEEELARARAQRSLTVERWHVRKDGSRFWGTGVLSALYDEAGRLYGYVKVLRDNTERKFAIETLRQAKIDAELANSAKDFFLANVSHELRTPLSAMLLWAKLLSGQQHPSPRQLREGLAAIVKSGEEQHALIEDLMDTSRIAAGKMRLEMENVPLVPLVEKALEVVRLPAAQKTILLSRSLDDRAGTVRADPLRLQQVLVNLLNNAVKFTPEGGSISILLKRTGPEIEIQVRDTGQGISPEFIGRVFDRFTQADASAVRVNGGLGLGLSIARQLVALHRGTIAVHSEGINQGTTFTVRLPLPPLAPGRIRAGGKAAKPPSLRGLNILLVEDMAQTRRALTAVLRDAQATVVAVDSAQAALRRFNESRPDLLLSDIGLGQVSGHELLGEIRRSERVQKSSPVPALALTAYADERTRQLAIQSGFQYVLTKPVEPAELITKLASLGHPERT